MTKVHDMRDLAFDADYSLPPEYAVEQAYRQFELHDMNWWLPRTDMPAVEEGRHFYYCGPFAARKDAS